VDGLAAGVDASVGVATSLGVPLADAESDGALSLDDGDADAPATGLVSVPMV
jgi:hypothetical protein